MATDLRLENLRSQFKTLRVLYLLFLFTAVLALFLYFVNRWLAFLLMGLSVVAHLTVIRRKSGKYVRDFIHESAQITLARHLAEARHTERPVLEPDRVREVRLIPANRGPGAVLCREGGTGSYHGLPVRLGDVTFVHTYRVGKKTCHEFRVGCWVTLELGADTRMDCRFLGNRAVSEPSLEAMLREEADLKRLPAPLPDWIVIAKGEGVPPLDRRFLRGLEKLGENTGGGATVCVIGDRLHVFLPNELLGQKVSVLFPPGEGFLHADLLPDLTVALSLAEAFQE